MSEHFYLTLPSNSSAHFFPENKISNFKTHLSRHISLEGEWEVGLCEIHFPLSTLLVSKDDLFIGCLATKALLSSKFYLKRKMNDGKIENWSYTSFPALAQSSPENLLESLMKDEVFKQIGSISIVQSRVQIQLKDYIKGFTLSPSLAQILGLPDREFRGVLTIEGEAPFNSKLCTPKQMYVYGDLVEPQHVGDVLAPLLRIITFPTSPETDQTVNIFTHPHYMPLMKREFQVIEIDIRDDLGKTISFASGLLNVKLHFRKVIRST